MILLLIAALVILWAFFAIALIRERARNRRLLSKFELMSNFDELLEVQCNISELINEFRITVSSEIAKLDSRCREVELLSDVVDEKILRLSTWCEGIEDSFPEIFHGQIENRDVEKDTFSNPDEESDNF